MLVIEGATVVIVIITGCVAGVPMPLVAVIVIVPVGLVSLMLGVPESVLPVSVSHAGSPLMEIVGVGAPVATMA